MPINRVHEQNDLAHEIPKNIENIGDSAFDSGKAFKTILECPRKNTLFFDGRDP